MRYIFAFLIGVLLYLPALAQQVPHPGAGVLDAKGFGVKADGITSDDVAMKTAVDACNETPGHMLMLPSGQILMTGAAQVTINGCNLVGAGVAPEGGQLKGTTFLLTSTTVTPFIFGVGGNGLEGINFYYPNQTTGAAYPPLFTDTPAGVGALHWNNLHILNAYKGFVQISNGTSGGLGAWFITNSSMYAVNDMFTICCVGDYLFFNNVRFNQGAWQGVDSSKPWWVALINWVAQNNTIFHITPPATGALATMKVSNVSAFAWGKGIKIDALPAGISFGNFQWSLDGVGTFIDTTAGGALYNFAMQCNNCIAGYIDITTGSGHEGNPTVFKLGAAPNQNFSLHDSRVETVGTVVETTGTPVFLDNNQISFGTRNDGNDYYLVKVNGGSAHVDVRNNAIFGQLGSTKHHGLTSTFELDGFAVQNNRFTYLNDVLNVLLGSSAQLFAGNSTFSIAGTGADILTTGTGKLVYSGNDLETPPIPTVSSCGAGAAMGGGSSITQGFIQVGSTVPTTSCQMTMPFNLGGAGACMFQPSASGVGNFNANPTGSPNTWTIGTENPMQGVQMFYHCGSDR